MNEDGLEFKSEIDGKEVTLKLLTENVDIEHKCDTEYHIAYTQLLKKGILPRATLEKQMAELGIWTKSEEEALGALQRQLVDLQIKLEKATTHEEGLAIAKEMGELRADCLKLVEAKAAVLSNSCESLADSIRRDAYIAYATVFADTKKRVFKDYHDFILRANEPVVFNAREQLLSIASDTFQQALLSLPEVGYVRSVERQIQDEAKKIKETPKKKTPRKKAVKRPRKVTN